MCRWSDEFKTWWVYAGVSLIRALSETSVWLWRRVRQHREGSAKWLNLFDKPRRKIDFFRQLQAGWHLLSRIQTQLCADGWGVYRFFYSPKTILSILSGRKHGRSEFMLAKRWNLKGIVYKILFMFKLFFFKINRRCTNNILIFSSVKVFFYLNQTKKCLLATLTNSYIQVVTFL